MEYKELEKKREKKTKDGTCGDGGLLSLRFVLHHQHTQVETRDNHPLPDSPPSISSHGGTKKKKEKTKTSCWTSFSASSSRTGSNAFIDNILSPVYKALTQFFFLSSRLFEFYRVFLFFSPPSADKSTRVDLFPYRRIKASRVHVDCPGSDGSLQTPTSSAQLVFSSSFPMTNKSMTSGSFESGKWSSVDRVKLSLQLAHRHFLSHRSNFFRKKKRKRRPNKNSMERDEKQKVESISREKMAAGPTQATSVSWPAAKAARLAYFGLVQLKSNQGSTFRPGREKGNLSCIIYMGERERWRDSEGEKLSSFCFFFFFFCCCCNTHQTFGGGGVASRPVPLHHGQVASGAPTGCQLSHGQKWRGALYSPPCIALISSFSFSSFFLWLKKKRLAPFLFAVVMFILPRRLVLSPRYLGGILPIPWIGDPC